LAENPPPEFGSEAQATVTAVRKAGAELALASGHEAFASNQHLVQHGEVYHAGEILQPGQEVTVRVGPWHAQAAKVSVSLRDFAPEPWDRLAEVYRPGDIVDGVVIRLQPYGAFVELLPGAEGLLHLSKISDQYVEYVEDFLNPGDRVTVRLLSLDPEYRKAEMSMVEVPKGAEPLPPASVYPGGPPWLPDSAEAFNEPDAEEPVGHFQGQKQDPAAAQAADASATGPDELALLKAQIAELQERLAALETEKAALAEELSSLR
ncbi:MAG: S1 RNA-binding domain-containing protein, partial [Solirubrobacteraceae bacterium]|nr:S1 RNA-binding domain-containing protein [Solirubrobacteraceae bacterium]